VGFSHQTQGGKSGANPALSRNCNEIIFNLLSQDARRLLSIFTNICEVQSVSKSFFQFQSGNKPPNRNNKPFISVLAGITRFQ
jgi:hypothetical protein